MNLTDITERYGTPVYVYDLRAVRRAHADLREALPQPSTLYYSLKANPHPLLVAELAARGCHAEVTSQGEVEAVREAGVDPGRVLMTGPGKTRTTLAHALGFGVRTFSVDSPLDIDRLGEVAAEHDTPVDCLLRINVDEDVPGMGLSMTGTASQFGADASWVMNDAARFSGNDYTRVTGLHLYMGTNILDEETLLREFEIVAGVAGRMASVLGGLREVDLGGGFGAPYATEGERPRFPHLAERLAPLLDENLPGWREGEPRISFESGRYLVGDSGTLACEVLDQKTSKGKNFTILDSGINHLGGMSGLRRLPPMATSVRPADGDEGTKKPVSTNVVGPLCTPLDTLARSVELPEPEVGHYVAIPNVGAYGLTASLLAFLGHPAPLEVVHDGEEIVGLTRLHIDRFEVATPARTSAAS